MHLAAFENHDAIGQRHRVRHTVSHQQDGEAFVFEARYQIEQDGRFANSKRCTVGSSSTSTLAFMPSARATAIICR